MAQFRATIQGQRGEASRLGSKSSGIQAHIAGWTNGVEVVAKHIDGKDIFSVYQTTGSSHKNGRTYLGKVVEGVFVPA